ncbi:hypothetical protein [Methanoculleus chikugoensis]|uniref:hypothetical protein n=1 Tax=Methanoculleus chikugoensis TaxID=118126 RepID=UPI000A7BA1FE|nr:hypothetical protein [Methanoculleus chikugoensis]
MKPYGMPARSLRPPRLFLLVAFSALLIMPCSVSGATPPPPLPSLTLSLSNDTLFGDEDLVISAAWSRDASFYRPPGSVDVLIYSASSGSPVAGYTILEDDRVAADDTTRYFRGTVPSSELPEGGKLLLVATDPVSGAEARAPDRRHRTGSGLPPAFRRSGMPRPLSSRLRRSCWPSSLPVSACSCGGREGGRSTPPAPPPPVPLMSAENQLFFT